MRETDAEDDVAGSLLDALAHEGHHVDDGAFTLDSVAAYRKLRDHQLADPHGYVLLLVEAAWLANDWQQPGGVSITPGVTTTVEFRGLALEPGSLPELYSAVLGGLSRLEGEDLRRARVLQLIGLAANNALALGPKQLIIDASARNGESERVTIDANGELESKRGKPMLPGTIRFALRGVGLGRARIAAERALLEQRCRYTSLEVRVDDTIVSDGPRADLRDDDLGSSAPTRTAVNVSGEPIGVAGQTCVYDTPAVAWIVNRGVAVRDPLADASVGVQAVVEVDLPMDLSRNHLSDCAELEAIRAGIRVAIERVPRPVPPAKAAESRSNVGPMLLGLALAAGIVGWTWVRHTPPPRAEIHIEIEPTTAELIMQCRARSFEACDKLVHDEASLTHAQHRDILEPACDIGVVDACREQRGPDVDCLLDPSLAKCQTPGAAPPSSLPRKLGSAQIKLGIDGVKPAVEGCAAQYGAAAGTVVIIRFVLEGSTGSVRAAEAKDEHAGTKLGECVEAAAKQATFAKFQASRQGFSFKFRL